jgi:hypothetical protein
VVALLSLTAGDAITIGTFKSSVGAVTLNSGTNTNYLSIMQAP